MTRRRPGAVAVLAAVVALVAVAGAVFAVAGQEPPTPREQTRAVASTLRCPSCVGEHVADSTSPVAESMRLVVAEQLDAGRSPDQVRAWFADAYGDDVLLEPPRRGPGWALWVVPLVVVGAASLWFARRRGRPALGTTAVVVGVTLLGVWWLAPGALTGPDDAARAGTDDTTNSTADGTASPPRVAVTVLEDAAADQPGRVELRAALARQLEKAGRTDDSVAQWAAAVRLRPMDPDLRYRHAFALVRTGASGEAVSVLDGTLTVDPDHAPTLLLLGSVLEESDPERSAELRERYRAARDGAEEQSAEVPP
ncbi:cytochrome c-type biogenesis protein CcmH [Promicromonospora iranensis]|uniref:Cytochrome c-type biogenesis protein n=1 Tax=Promicromonospora iranensis TaxID=1105144 RepID=A0ABU2CI76_9MICO|nr:cytochrome c-type biogenesis protein CcmH [Promicromonospora iranensis]MDR7381040.1 cytochrome c-type biogenesis protein CcmH/NrfF [Promicromonospora iranensis]